MADYTTEPKEIINGAPDENREEIWVNFGKTLFNEQTDEVGAECKNYSLAYDVLEAFNIPHIYTSQTNCPGEAVTNIDIKRMDARTAINWSLLEASARDDNSLYEPIVNGNGQVEIIQVGEGSPGFSTSDIYYEVSTGTYTESPTAVMVTGGRPVPERQPLVWRPIWGEGAASIYTMKDIFDNCHKAAFSRYATIVFRDPNLDTQYEDGIDNLYEISDTEDYDDYEGITRYDRVLGYAKYKRLNPEYATKDTTVKYANSSSIPIKIGESDSGAQTGGEGFEGGGTDDPGPYLGNLQNPPTFAAEGESQTCYTNFGEVVDATDGVRVDIPTEFRFETVRGTTVDNFIEISGVYVIGREIDLLWYRPKDVASSIQDPTSENGYLWVSINKPEIKTFRLEEGTNYAVAFSADTNTGEGDSTTDESDFVVPYIVFAKDVRYNDPLSYGQGTTYYVDPWCTYSTEVLSDEEKYTAKIGCILPMSKTRGILVYDVWVTADIETPCIVVEDPDGREDRAFNLARTLDYYIAPLMVREFPNPTAYKGPSIVGATADVNGVYLLEQPVYDRDPTTAQNFESSPYELALDQMQGGGMSVTLAFLNDDDKETRELYTRNMANRLYEYMNDDLIETIYTLAPDANPKLGRAGLRGGTINAVRYAYNDSGSYTISVTEGPKLVGGLAQVDGGRTEYMAEDINARGTVIASRGDNMHFKVRIDGFGERWALSMTHEIIRVGDVVNCSIHNCPIES